jgi:DNA repair protein RadC
MADWREFPNDLAGLRQPVMNLSGRLEEALLVAHLDQAGAIIALQDVSQRSEHRVELPLRDIVAEALRRGSFGIVLSHNHPSRMLRPSQADIAATRRAESVLVPLGIFLVDHFVVSADGYFSFREAGLL